MWAVAVYQRCAESLISDSDSSPTPKVFLITYSNSELFKAWKTNVVTSKSHFTLATFLVSILKFDTRLRLHTESNNKRYTPTPIQFRLHSNPSHLQSDSVFAHLCCISPVSMPLNTDRINSDQ